MTTTCGICGWAFEAPESREDGATPRCARCCDQPALGDDEPAYQSDLRSLVQRAQASTRVGGDQGEDKSCIEVPQSVREAIRNAEAPIFSEQVLAAALAARRPRLKLAAFPVIALALTGVVIGAERGSRPNEAAVARLLPPVAGAMVPRQPVSEALAPPQERPRAEPTVQPAIAPPVAAPLARSGPARPPPAPAAHPRAAPAPSLTATQDPPSLMEAITNAVHGGPSSVDRR